MSRLSGCCGEGRWPLNIGGSWDVLIIIREHLGLVSIHCRLYMLFAEDGFIYRSYMSLPLDLPCVMYRNNLSLHPMPFQKPSVSSNSSPNRYPNQDHLEGIYEFGILPIGVSALSIPVQWHVQTHLSVKSSHSWFSSFRYSGCALKAAFFLF